MTVTRNIQKGHGVKIPYVSSGSGYNWIVVAASGPVKASIHVNGSAIVKAMAAERLSFGAFIEPDGWYEVKAWNESDHPVDVMVKAYQVRGPHEQLITRHGGGCLSALALVLLALLAAFALA